MANYDKLFSLNGKTALITGGTGGLGSAVALSFLQKGAQVAVCSNHPEKAAPAADYAKSSTGPFFLSPVTSPVPTALIICWMRWIRPLAP